MDKASEVIKIVEWNLKGQGNLFYIPHCGTYVPHCGMYIPHCGIYVPQWGI